MRKRHLRNKIKSIVGRYIDPEKDEELKGSNIEMEDNYKKILELLRVEDQDDKTKIVGLIEDFHKHYQSIYERYDNITGELRAKVNSTKERDSSSSSDSDESSSKNGSKNGKLENEIYKVADSLKEELQKANAEIDELRRKLSITTDEKEALSAEYQASLNKVQEIEKMFGELKLEADRLHEENSKLLADNRDLISKFENAKLLEAEFSQKIEDINSEKETAIGAIEEEKRGNEELRAVIVQLEGEKEAFKSDMKGVKAEFSKLQEKLKTTEEELLDLLKKSEDKDRESASQIDNLTENVNNLQKELESLQIQKSKLEEHVNEKQEEITSLCSQKHESESQLEKSTQEISDCLIQIESLKQELAIKIADEQRMVEEKEVYAAKVKDLEEELKSLQTLKTESETEVNQKTQEIAEYLTQIENLKEEVANKAGDQERLLEEKTDYESKVKDLESKLESLHNLKNESEMQLEKKGLEISELLSLNQNLKEELESKNNENLLLQQELQDKIQELEKTLVDRGDELSKHVVGENEASAQITALTQQVNNLQEEINALNAQKNETESNLVNKIEEMAGFLIQIEKSESKIVDQERAIKSAEDFSTKLSEENKRLEACLQDAELKIKEMAEEIRNGIQSKEQSVDELEETIEDLRRDLEIKGDEVSTLTENVRNLEVKIRLANQKLRVTEQTLNETEDDHSGKEAKLHQENKSLVARIAMLSETITSYKEAETRVKREVLEKVNETLGGMDSLAVKFEEDYGHIETQVNEIMNEVHVTKIWAKEMSSEKDQLKEKVKQMAIKLEDLEGEKERLKKSVDQLEVKIKEMENGIVGKDEKIKELENILHVKDEGILDLGEEKREAIRQLCLWVDYQRDRFDHLQELLSKTTTGGRRQIAR